MLFGIPWFGIIAIVAIAGGLIYAYKEKELEVEEKIQVKAREVRELEKVVHNLKSRVDSLEERLDREAADKKKESLRSEIEINDEFDDQNSDNESPQTRKRAQS